MGYKEAAPIQDRLARNLHFLSSLQERGRSEFVSARVVAEPLLVAAPDGHAFAAADAVSINDLDGQPFVMYSPYESRYFYDLLVTQFTRAEILPRYVQHLSQIHSILAMVRVRTADTVRFIFRAIAGAFMPVSSIARS